jgi:hypothetical protein
VTRDAFDAMIGRLDRVLSEFLLAAESPVDEADWQTIKHHADDLIGVGTAAQERLARAKGPPMPPPVQPPEVATQLAERIVEREKFASLADDAEHTE